jgi:hypothetical protein
MVSTTRWGVGFDFRQVHHENWPESKVLASFPFHQLLLVVVCRSESLISIVRRAFRFNLPLGKVGI